LGLVIGMFKKVRIQNFRQFKDLALDNLAQVNLITGANNTGKTSVLEALLLHTSPSDPNTIRILANQREMASILPEGPGAWGWIFREAGEAACISIEPLDDPGNRATLKIESASGLQIPHAGTPRANGNASASEPVISTSGRPLHSLVLEYVDSRGRRGGSQVRNDGSIELFGEVLRFRRWYQATKAEPPVETAQIYSRVVLADREEAVIEALRVVDSRLKRLRVLDTGTGPSIHADFGEGKFLPVSVAGRGFSRMLTLACVLVDNAGGLVLIDEIEDGLHYSVLPDVWKVIVQTALFHSVQIVATTHSLEAINAAVDGSEDHEGSLAFYRLERRKGDIAVVAGEDRRLRAAVSVGFELR
jgi:predicted ATPase